MLGVAAIAGAGILLVTYRKFFEKGAQEVFKGTADAVAGGVEQKQLQKDAVSRLNDFSARLRNLPSVDLSAQVCRACRAPWRISEGNSGTATLICAVCCNCPD